MLILTRTAGEDIVIGEGESRIVIRVIETGRNQVRIGIEAPRSVPVSRRGAGEDADREFARGILET